MSWKQKFCLHIWKEIGREGLRRIREKNGAYNYSTYDYVAIIYECIKCKKKKIEEHRFIVI